MKFLSRYFTFKILPITPYFILLCLIILFLLHIPFLTADPDKNISFSRDVFTDEGLYTSQIRNYINHHHFKIDESDALIKTPFFTGILFFPFTIFGTYLLTARLTILLFFLLTLFFISRNSFFKKIILLLFPTTLIQYHIFHYSHFSLAEILSTCFIFSSIISFQLFIISEIKKRKTVFLFLYIMFSFLAFYTKIQFAYVIALPVIMILVFLMKSIKEHNPILENGKIFVPAIVFFLFLFFLYFFLWKLPNKALLNFILADQTTNRFSSIKDIPDVIKFNYQHEIFPTHESKFYVLCFLISLLIGIILYFRNSDKNFKVLFITSLCWIIIESHKLILNYLPSRYLVSFYFAIGIFMVNVFSEVIFQASNKEIRISNWIILNKIINVIFVALIISLFISNILLYLESFQRRTYLIKDINNYLEKYKKENMIMIGAWAPTMSWENKAITIPVWKNYFNDRDPIKKFKPIIVFSETDEKDSEEAYKSRGIDLHSLSDSVKTFTIGKNWHVNLYWIKSMRNK